MYILFFTGKKGLIRSYIVLKVLFNRMYLKIVKQAKNNAFIKNNVQTNHPRTIVRNTNLQLQYHY